MKDAIAAGADLAFVEGVESEDHVRQAVKALAPTPVLVNLVRGGSTPDWTAADCEAMGAKLVVRFSTSLL
jgi:2-methylisocitrate lyase-like PEP mutase family enzyme